MSLDQRAVDVAAEIGMFYLEKNKFDYEKTRYEINRLYITNICTVTDSKEPLVSIETKRPGLLIGKRGQNITALEEYIGMKIYIMEAPARETDYLVPEPVDESVWELESNICETNETGKKWFLPVGLYPYDMEKLTDLKNLLKQLGVTTSKIQALDKVILYFRDEHNEAYQDMLFRDSH